MARKARQKAPTEGYGRLPGESFLRGRIARSQRLKVRQACRTQDWRRLAAADVAPRWVAW
jgi:hypothetical protein